MFLIQFESTTSKCTYVYSNIQHLSSENVYDVIEVAEMFFLPDIHMGMLDYFFKLSYVMKDYHKILTEDYKFSMW